jgi:ATP-binding cassette subfamily B protein
MLNRLVPRVIESTVALVQLLVNGIGVFLVLSHGLSVGTLPAFAGLLGVLGNSYIRLSLGLPEWLGVVGPLRRIEALLGAPVEVTDAPDAVSLPRLQSEICVDGVSYTHPASAQPALHGVTLTIAKGRSIGIVGRNGSGKSTLVSLLLRLRDPNEGTLSVDRCDLRHVTRASLRGQIGVVFQDTTLFNRSVGDNIRVGRPSASDAQIDAAVMAAGVEAIIKGLPDGYGTPAGEKGLLLSGGQRQAIGLARAMLIDPAIMVLDEATSALDPAAEAAVGAALQRMSGDRTLIWITHRLANVAGLDHILVFDGGRIVEEGTHEQLLAAFQHYAQLWNSQSGFFVSGDARRAAITPERLNAIPLFVGVDPAVLRGLAEAFQVERYEPGYVIVREGDSGDRFYVIVRGLADVIGSARDGKEHLYQTLEDGDYFGEIALLEDVPRTATVRARTSCLVLALPREDFLNLLEMTPTLRRHVELLVAERRSNLAAHALTRHRD